MFILKDELTVEWPVKVRVPVNGGKYREQEFIARFKVLEQSKVERFDLSLIDSKLLKEALIGWFGIRQTEDGPEVEFSEDVRDQLIDQPHVRAALINAYSEAVQGRRAKN